MRITTGVKFWALAFAAVFYLLLKMSSPSTVKGQSGTPVGAAESVIQPHDSAGAAPSGRIDTTGMMLEDPAHQSSSVPLWAFTPVTPPGHSRPMTDSGTVLHVPGSGVGYTRAQINDGYNVPDWFPAMHPPAPPVVIHGKRGLYQGCGLCHLPTGYGRPENSSINGLPAKYILDQMEDFKNDLRHSSTPNAGLITMIPVAKNISPEEAKKAAEYYASVKPTKYIRVIESDTVPVTRPNARMLVPDEAGGTEPIGNRVIEIPENVEHVEMRDSAVGFIAYVPKGSIAKGEELAQKGDGARVPACVICHGPSLTGMGDTIPTIAGRSPSQMARQLYDFKTGARHGKSSPMMAMPVAHLTDEDIVNIVAYLASLPQKQ